MSTVNQSDIVTCKRWGKLAIAVTIVIATLVLLSAAKTQRRKGCDNASFVHDPFDSGDGVDRTGDSVVSSEDPAVRPSPTIASVDAPIPNDRDGGGGEPPPTGKPLFALHIGPPKTGTTSVQCYAGAHKDVLFSNNVHFLGTNRNRGCGGSPDVHAKRLGIGRCSRYCNCTAEYWDTLEEQATRRYEYVGGDNNDTGTSTSGSMTAPSVLFSDELLFWASRDCEYLWSRLGQILDDSRWRVRVIFTYRRYYDWLVSEFHQSYNAEKGSFRSWPDEGGKIMPSFADFFEETRVDYEARAVRMQDVKRRYEERVSPDVWIVNMHEEGDFLSNFFCGALPEAPTLCSQRRSEVDDVNNVVEMNPSSSKSGHDCFDRLAVSAYERGWVNKSLSRAEVRTAVEERCKKELELSSCTRDFPLKCPSSEQRDALLEMSLRLEADLVPHFFASPMGKAKLLEGFADAAARKKFCWADTDLVLREDGWRNFFSNLNGLEDANK